MPDLPTLQSLQDTETNMVNFNEIVTSDQPVTASEDSDGNKHKTLKGLEEDVQNAIEFTPLGLISGGVTFTALAQYAEDNSGRLWSPRSSASLPYTTSDGNNINQTILKPYTDINSENLGVISSQTEETITGLSIYPNNTQLNANITTYNTLDNNNAIRIDNVIYEIRLSDVITSVTGTITVINLTNMTMTVDGIVYSIIVHDVQTQLSEKADIFDDKALEIPTNNTAPDGTAQSNALIRFDTDDEELKVYNPATQLEEPLRGDGDGGSGAVGGGDDEIGYQNDSNIRNDFNVSKNLHSVGKLTLGKKLTTVSIAGNGTTLTIQVYDSDQLGHQCAINDTFEITDTVNFNGSYTVSGIIDETTLTAITNINAAEETVGTFEKNVKITFGTISNITSILGNGTLVDVVTATPHDLSPGDTFRVNGTTEYNEEAVVKFVVSDTEFMYESTVNQPTETVGTVQNDKGRWVIS